MATEKKDKILEVDKKSGFETYNEAAKILLEQTKRDLDEINHKIQLKEIEMTNLDQSIVKKQSEFEQWRRSEEKKHTSEYTKKWNDLVERENRIAKSEIELTNRLANIQQREDVAIKLREKENTLNNERLEIEKIRSDVKLQEHNVGLKQDQLNAIEGNLVNREIESKEIIRKANEINSSLAVREEDIKKQLDNIKASEKNYEKLKDFVEPKIKEIKLKEDEIDKKLKEIKASEDKVIRINEENKSMLAGIETREKKVKDREKTVVQKEEEINRKALLLEIGKDK